MANISHLLALLFAALMISAPLFVSADSSPIEDDPLADAPTIDFELAPFYPPQYFEPDVALPPNDSDFPGFSSKNQLTEFLLKCQEVANLDSNCGIDYHASVFRRDLKPTRSCCRKLVAQGKVCHDLVTRYILRYGGFNYNREKSLERSEHVWKHCTLVVHN
ncbi:hypothetical protein QQ045_025405 [Rhodiola kirilowii]